MHLESIPVLKRLVAFVALPDFISNVYLNFVIFQAGKISKFLATNFAWYLFTTLMNNFDMFFQSSSFVIFFATLVAIKSNTCIEKYLKLYGENIELEKNIFQYCCTLMNIFHVAFKNHFARIGLVAHRTWEFHF